MKSVPIWADTADGVAYPRATNATVDVAVIGGGLAGLTTAYRLKKAGKRTGVIEMGSIGSGQSGQTTAHLTWIIDQSIDQLYKDFGERAHLVLQAHATAIDEIERIAREEQIDCDFTRLTAYRYGLSPDDREQLVRDVARARALGRQCDFVDPQQVPVPCKAGAMRVPDQGKFHPRKYVLGLASRIATDGCHIFENSRVTSVQHTKGSWRITAADAVITAEHVVVATHSPIGLVPSLQTRLEPYQTYAIAAKVPKNSIAAGLYWDTLEPYQYTRVDAGAEQDVVIVGGADHKTGAKPSVREPIQYLKRYLSDHLGVTTFALTHQWSGQVLEPVDGVAYIGRHPGLARNRWVATGFSGNGMTYSTISGMLLCDLILGRKNAWEQVFDPGRINLAASAPEFFKANAAVAAHFVLDRLLPTETRNIAAVPSGEGRMVWVGGKKLAVYRDERGTVTALSPACPHMGCTVKWNSQAKSWDCPCHGSRFHPSGEVAQGPATQGLERIEIEMGEPIPAGT